MNAFSDEMILYCGLSVAALSILSGIACYVIFTIKKHKLNAKLDAEYGEVKKSK